MNNGLKAVYKNTVFTKENASKMGKKGGVKSGESKRYWKDLKHIAKELLHNPNMISPKTKKILLENETISQDIKLEDITNGFAMVIKQIDKAIVDGDTSSFIAIQATAGEKPIDRVQHSSDPENPIFNDMILEKIKKLNEQDK